MPHTNKILIITDNLPSQINGVVTTYKNIEQPAKNDGYSVHYIHPEQFKHISSPKYPELKLSYPRRIGRYIRAVNPNYIHIATEGPLGIAARFYLSKRKIPYTTAYHTKFPEAIKKILGIPEFVTWPLIRWFHADARKVLTTTNSMVKQLQLKGFGDNVRSWTRGVDRKIFKPNKQTALCGRPLLVCVSRVSAEKNLESFFEIEYPGATKMMVGDGPKLEYYKKKYSDVHFVGSKQGQELADYYQQADVFVFPSRWDTFGLVIIEAMACGTPVAAYPVQGPLDVIDQGVTGIMDENLTVATRKALDLDREQVYNNSLKWNWERAWEIFKDNLVEIKLQ